MDALLALPGHRRDRLIQGLESGRLAPPYDDTAIAYILGPDAETEGVLADLSRFSDQGVGPAAVAILLSKVAGVIASVPRPEIVWSGPEVPGVHARDTRRVFEELVGGAEQSLVISSYAFFDGPRAFELLASRMDTRPDLRVSLCLNIQRGKGDTSAPDEVVYRFAEKFWKKDWPGTRRPAVYYDPRSLEPNGPDGILHAKAVVADRRDVLITSANLTEAAFDRNYELGLVVRDIALAATVAAQFQVLIDRKLLKPLPSA